MVELTPKPDSFGRLNKKPIERVRLKSGSIDQESEDRPRVRNDSGPLYKPQRFGKQKRESRIKNKRIIVKKPHYPKYLVNYPFEILTAFLDLSESVVWNESGTNHESGTNRQRIMNGERIVNESGTKNESGTSGPPVENGLQWKMSALRGNLVPHQWKMIEGPRSELNILRSELN